MARMSRQAQWIFANFVVGTALFTYGKVAYQEPVNQPGLRTYSASYYDVETLSPWIRLQRAQDNCLHSAIYRDVPLRSDGDTVEFKEACIGDRVLTLEHQGGDLNPFQAAVATAAKKYNEQWRYFYAAGFFWFLSASLVLYIKAKAFWEKYGKPLRAFWRSCRDVVKKMSA